MSFAREENLELLCAMFEPKPTELKTLSGWNKDPRCAGEATCYMILSAAGWWMLSLDFCRGNDHVPQWRPHQDQIENEVALRVAMAAAGWDSEDRITTFGFGTEGKYGYMIWFGRWDWHGRTVTHWKYAYASSPEPEAMAEVTLEAACKAAYAWTKFPDSVPYWTSNNEFAVDVLATRLWREARERAPTLHRPR